MNKKMISTLKIILIALSVIFTGYMAGFFWTYSFNINRAMLEVDGATYAIVQSLYNVNVRHAFFFLFFMGSGLVTSLAALIHIRQFKSATFWLLLAAAVIYIGGIIFFTQAVNLPLNYYTESWDPNNLPLDWEATRAAWNRANDLRVGTSAAAFLLSIGAMMSSKFES